MRERNPIALLIFVNMPFLELYHNNGRTTDYPFGFLQVKLDAQGKGSGQPEPQPA